MKRYSELSLAERRALYALLNEKYNGYTSANLSLDLSRGKPNSKQLDLSQGIMSVDMSKENCFSDAGFDCRNYGLLDGIAESKELFAELLGVETKNIVIGGNASLELMFSFISQCYS